LEERVALEINEGARLEGLFLGRRPSELD